MNEQADPRGKKERFNPARVDQLLGTGGGLLGEVIDNTVAQWEIDEQDRWIGAEVGPFRILEFLNRGGTSLVYRAERCDGQYERLVAVKVLNTTNSSELANRFVQERQLLASLEHPGIAQILDSGVADHQPWIAMEFVDGELIDEYCDQHALAIDERLDLIAQVSRAVQYAHGRLVVHRDLKPSNILVTGNGQAKLLDFGIAKTLQNDASERLTNTTMLLTPQYASPEQVLGEHVGVTSDIYQIGLLLYRLLTGCDAHEIGGSSIADINSAVIDSDPLSPSRRIKTTGQRDIRDADSVARARSTSPVKLIESLNGDLDAIVLKCLNKNPADRYFSVQSLINDIQAYQDMRPIQARPPTIAYRANRFMQRNRGGVFLGVTVVLLLTSSLVSVGLSWRSTILAQDKALEEAVAAKQVSDFLEGALEQANPELSGGEQMTVHELLDQAVSELDALRDQPTVHARLLEVMSRAYTALALPDQAEPLAHAALALREQMDDPAGIVEPLTTLALIHSQLGEFDEAITVGQRAVETAMVTKSEANSRAAAHRVLSEVHFQRGSYVDEREQLSLALAQIDSVDTAQSRLMRADLLTNLGSNSRQLGEYARARREYESALTFLGDALAERVTRILTLRELGTLHSVEGNETLAIEMLGRSLDLARETYGNQSAHLLGNLVLLGRSLVIVDRIDDAEALFLEALSVAEGTIGKKHGNYARILHDYAAVLRKRGEFEHLREVYDEAAEIAKAFFGPNHSTTVNLRKARAFSEFDQGRYPKALVMLDRILPNVRQTFGGKHMITFDAEALRAHMLLETGEFETAREAMSNLVASGKQIAGGSFWGYERNLRQLSRLHGIIGSSSEALRIADQAVALRDTLDSASGWTMLVPLVTRIHALASTTDRPPNGEIKQALQLVAENADRLTVHMRVFLSEFAMNLAQMGFQDDANELCAVTLAALRDALSMRQPLLAYTRLHCADVSLSRGDIAEATRLLNLAVPIVSETLGANNWRTLWALAMQAVAADQRQQSDQALSSLRALVGDNSPFVLRIEHLKQPDH